MPPRERRRWWAVASHGRGAGPRYHAPLFWAEAGVWVGHARDARKFHSALAAEQAARELGGEAVVVEMEG